MHRATKKTQKLWTRVGAIYISILIWLNSKVIVIGHKFNWVMKVKKYYSPNICLVVKIKDLKTISFIYQE